MITANKCRRLMIKHKEFNEVLKVIDKGIREMVKVHQASYSWDIPNNMDLFTICNIEDHLRKHGFFVETELNDTRLMYIGW